jgi:prepilin-type N-terminal cleavage/methylation domain-containing protein
MALRRDSGLTLIEVLVASVILFGALVVATQAYSGALLSDRKSQELLFLLGPTPLVVNAIQGDIRVSPTESVSGSGQILDVSYEYVAKSVFFKPPPPRLDPDSGAFADYPSRYRLYDVTLTLTYKSQRRMFKYQELAWLSPQGK